MCCHRKRKGLRCDLWVGDAKNQPNATLAANEKCNRCFPEAEANIKKHKNSIRNKKEFWNALQHPSSYVAVKQRNIWMKQRGSFKKNKNKTKTYSYIEPKGTDWNSLDTQWGKRA